jgi:hypothetical protein
MTNEELVKRLRNFDDGATPTHEAADRIEALTAERAKAVEALREIGKTYSADGSRLIHSDKQIINMVCIALAEIEGKKR